MAVRSLVISLMVAACEMWLFSTHHHRLAPVMAAQTSHPDTESISLTPTDYYISRDVAMTLFLTKPLQGGPLDIVVKLKKIGRTRYTSDRKFHTDVHEAIEPSHDGYAMYFPYCYMAYYYDQPFSLYAPVIDGKQITNGDFSLQLALRHHQYRRGERYGQIKKRADLLFNSKNPSVRLNETLASITYQPGEFTDTASYTKNVGLSQPAPPCSWLRTPPLYAQADTSHATSPPTLPVDPEAIKLGTGNCTVFHQLRDRPVLDPVTERRHRYHHQRDWNNGGYANVAPDFVQLFFPTKGPLDKVIRVNFRSTPAIQQLNTTVYNLTDGGRRQKGNMLSFHGGVFYDSLRFFDLTNNRTYTDNSLFTDTPVRPNLAKYPWTNNPDHLRILTDGTCPSGCGHVIYLTASQYGVGGAHGEPLYKYQYMTAAGTQLRMFNGLFAFANMTCPIKDLPYQGILSATVGEIVAPGSTVPLEFDSVKYPTNFKLDFDPVDARFRKALWTQGAEAAWKQRE
ncbi:hypothetical protein BGZ47_010212 [Haplosporangium gracile]|nr:hypothetical protein BGZ47_010212 [Haplosporangium gracile]